MDGSADNNHDGMPVHGNPSIHATMMSVHKSEVVHGSEMINGSDMNSGNQIASDVEVSQTDESVRACGNDTTQVLASSASNGDTNKKLGSLDHFTLETVSEECTEVRCNRCWKTFAYISGSKFRSFSHLKRHLYSCHVTKSLGRPSTGRRDRDSRGSGFQIEVPDGHKEVEETKAKIQYTRPPPLPLKCPGYAVIDMKGSMNNVRLRWRRAILTFRLWCFSTSDQRYQFGHPHKLSCMLPRSGHFLFYFCHGSTTWLCAVIDGPSGYLDGYITRSTGKHYELRVRENQAKKQKGRPLGPHLMRKQRSYLGLEIIPLVHPAGWAFMVCFGQSRLCISSLKQA